MTFIFPRGHLSGLTLSTAGSSSTFGVSAGQCADSTNALLMNFPSAFTKTTAAWAIGTGNGALDTGTIAASTWYHVHAIDRTDTLVPDIVVSLSASGPTLPSGYTVFRRIGSMLTDGSGNWIKFTQYGDHFRWATSVFDCNAVNPGTVAVTRTLTVPTGIVVEADIGALIAAATDNVIYVLITALAETDRAASGTDFTICAVYTPAAGIQAASPVRGVFTNTSAQIRTRQSASQSADAFNIATFGWIDTRGRFA